MRRYLKKLEQLLLSHRGNWKKWRGMVTVMAMIVVFVTTYALILPAITLEKDQGKTEQGVYLENVERGSTASLEEDDAGQTEGEPGQNSGSSGKAGSSSDYIPGMEDADRQGNVSSQGGETHTNNPDSGRKDMPDQSGTDQNNSCTAYAHGVYTGKGDGYTVFLDLKEEMRIPADVTVSVEEIREEDITSEYRSCLSAARRASAREGRGEITTVRFFKFALLSGGREVR